MKILAIGAAGFLGSIVVAELVERKAHVLVADFKDKADNLPAGVEYRHLDVMDFTGVRTVMEEAKPEVVINLAGLLTGLCAREPYKATQVNVMGMANVLEASRFTGVKRVVLSSSAGVTAPERIDTREEAKISPDVTMYGATKFYDEILGREYHRNYGIEVACLRYSLIYGPGEVATPGNALRLKTIESCVLGNDIHIDDATGEDRAHLLNVYDAAHATVLAATATTAVNGVFNISGMPEDFLSFQEVVDVLHEAFPGSGKVLFTGKKAPQEFGLYFHDKARRAFGFVPTISARNGLIANAKQRLEKIQK
ncbi:MAG: NAD(P)-dependent oxidoreductase [Desulfovibrio sp.]|uniref:NAD-dependent epimerase/dehydratase family protein n=1 Tax=Desulfovibrio sp. TaxID=885 RepID=UPI001A6E8472|nr:NAD(P)-dependent oxidoreductase [Desulfovibrio sp.]MBD5416522.1 NAD(P)-dependent oxidoreductase [Desulfovibrio sp.]